MKRHLNTLFVTTDGSYLSKQRESVVVKLDGQILLRVPIHMLGGIVCFGRIGCSPALFGLCGQRDVAVSFLTPSGRFLARVTGFTSGNVLLRREQYRWADDAQATMDIARAIVLAKISNTRVLLRRAVRDYPGEPGTELIEATAARLNSCMARASAAADPDALRGIEGEAARGYFSVFDELLRSDREGFRMNGRSRRPPLDRVNALLSFLYAMLSHDARSACESVGLDPAVGFLHRDRPGRPGLALDLMEELRAFLCDRLVISLVNRGQIKPDSFVRAPTGAVRLTDEGRKKVIEAYQRRKQDEIRHPFLNEKVTIGLLLHLQTLLLSRHLRGELDGYPPFLWS